MLSVSTLYQSAFWFSSATLIERLTFFIIALLISRIGPKSLGIYFLSTALFKNITLFAYLLLATKFIWQTRRAIAYRLQEIRQLTALSLKVIPLLSLVTIAVFLSFGPIVKQFTHAAIIWPVFALLALAIPFQILDRYVVTLLSFLEKFKEVVIVQSVGRALFHLILAIVLVTVFNWGVIGAVISETLSVTIIALVMLSLLLKNLPPLDFSAPLTKTSLLPNFIQVANASLTTFSAIADLFLVGFFLGFAKLGHYVALLYLPLLIYTLPTTLFRMFLHVAALYFEKGQEIATLSRLVTKWILIVTLPTFSLVFFYPNQMINLLFGPHYSNELPIVKLLVLAFALQLVSWLSRQILIARKRYLANMASVFIFLMLFFTLVWWLIPQFGLLGAAIALLTASLADATIKLILLWKDLGKLFLDQKILKVASAGLLLFGFYYFVPNRPLIFLAVAIPLFFTAIWLTKAFTKEELMTFTYLIKKGNLPDQQLE